MRQVFAITGASAGIGRATALRLARDGAALVGRAVDGARALVVLTAIAPGLGDRIVKKWGRRPVDA